MSYDLICGITNLDHSRCPRVGLAPVAPVESKDQDIIERMIERTGSYSGWPVYLSQNRYSDYQSRAAKGDTRCKVVISILDRYIKEGKLTVSDAKKSQPERYPIGYDGSYPRTRRRRRHHHRPQGQTNQIPGQYYRGQPNQIPGQYSSQYQEQPDPQKLQLLRSTYQQIKTGHINWLVNQDRQNNNWNTNASTYLQTSKLWARQQLQQQQLPIRSDPTTAAQWQRPLSWFQSQTRAALNSASSQMASQITTSQSPVSSTQYTTPISYPTQTTSYAAPQTAFAPTTDTYYPDPGDGSYDDDNQSGQSSDEGTKSAERRKLEDRARKGDLDAILKLKRAREEESMSMHGWPSPLMMHGFVRDEDRASGEDGSGSFVGSGLTHGEYRALVVRKAIQSAGGKRPSTKHFFDAKSHVDRALGHAGVSICLPGARPGRKTI